MLAASLALCNLIMLDILRRAFEYEKKDNEEQVGQRVRKENNMFYVAHGTKRLNANRRAHGSCTPHHPSKYLNG